MCFTKASDPLWLGVWATELELSNHLISIYNLLAMVYAFSRTPVPRRITMNKSDLIEPLQQATGLSKTKTEKVVKLFFDETK